MNGTLVTRLGRPFLPRALSRWFRHPHWLVLAALAAVSLALVWVDGVWSADLADLLGAVRGTLYRLSLGMLIGSAAGCLLGALMGLCQPLDRLFGSLVHPLRQIPLFGWIPLIGLCFGLGEGARLSFVALAVGYVMVVAVHQAVRSVSKAQLELASVLRLSPLARLTLLIVPAALPGLFAGFRVALAAAWGASVGAEILMTGGPGLGAYLWSARELGRSDCLIAGTLVIVALGLLSNALLRRIEARALPWRVPASLRGGA